MTDTQNYDGTGKLGDAIAALYGCSPRSNNKISALVGEAKAALGVGKSKKLDADVNQSIWQWHFDRLHPEADADVKIDSQAAQLDSVNIISHTDSNESVELYSHSTPPDLVEIYSQPEPSLSVDIISHDDSNEIVEIISQPEHDESVEINSQYADTALVRIAFYIQRQGKKRVKQERVRQVIALDGFYINALMLATGIDKKGVPAWVQSAVNGWAAFDGELPVTRQVKLLIVRELTKAIEGR